MFCFVFVVLDSISLVLVVGGGVVGLVGRLFRSGVVVCCCLLIGVELDVLISCLGVW